MPELFAQWKRNIAAELFILENWRAPEGDMVTLMELQGYQIRRRRDGSLMNEGKQMRMTSLLKAIYSFGEVCYAGQTSIAKRMGSDSVKTVYRAVTDAKDLGALIEERSPYKTDAFRIAWWRLFDWTVAFYVSENGIALPTALHSVDRTPSTSDRTPSTSDRTLTPPRCPTIPIHTHVETHVKTPCVSGDGFQKFSSRGGGKGGWSKSITREMLGNQEQLESLFAEALRKGWLRGIGSDALPPLRLKFFTLAVYCLRRSSPRLRGTNEFIEEAGAVFTKALKAALAGDTEKWLGSNEDEDLARAMLRADELPRTGNLQADDRSQATDRAAALAELANFEARRSR